MRTNANADAWSVNAPFTDEQHAHVEAEADLFYTDFVERVAQGRELSAAEVEDVARGRVWTGADAAERGLVDELGGLRTAIRRAKVLAGIDADAKVGSRLPGLVAAGHGCGPSLRHSPPRHRCRSVRGAGGSSVAGVVDQAQRSLTGANALWLGQWRF